MNLIFFLRMKPTQLHIVHYLNINDREWEIAGRCSGNVYIMPKDMIVFTKLRDYNKSNVKIVRKWTKWSAEHKS